MVAFVAAAFPIVSQRQLTPAITNDSAVDDIVRLQVSLHENEKNAILSSSTVFESPLLHSSTPIHEIEGGMEAQETITALQGGSESLSCYHCILLNFEPIRMCVQVLRHRRRRHSSEMTMFIPTASAE